MGKWWEIKARGNESEVLIYGDIGESWEPESVSAREFLDALSAVDSEYLTVRINSFGGSVPDGLAIYNALKRHKAAVAVKVDGVAVSIASLIAMAGDTVEMADNSLMMIHAPWAGAIGNAKGMREMADILDKHAEAMATSYANKTGKPVADMLALLTDGDDHWYTAAEAVAAGFADVTTESLAVAASGFMFSRFIKSMPTGVDVPSTEVQTPAKATETAAVVAAQPSKEAIMAEVENKATEQKAADADKKAIKAAERNRRAEVRAMFQPFASRDGMSEVMDSILDDMDITVDQAREKLLAKLGEGSEPLATTPRVDVMEDEVTKLRKGAVEAMAHRVGVAKDDPTNEFRGMTLMEVGKRILLARGVRLNGSKMQIAGDILAHTSSDFPYLLENVAHKALQSAYGAFPSTWQLWCATGDVPDFKSNSRIRLGSFNSLDTIPEGGEYTEGTMGEEKETITAATKGKMITFSRQMLINDDLGGFSRVARLLGRAAARTVNSDVYTTLTSNPTMSDSVALFHATHGNLASPASAITVSSLGAARAAMRKQTDPDSNDYLNIQPKYALVPVALEDTARQVISSETDISKTNSRAANPIRNFAEVISDPYLDANSATAWYLAADANDAPLIEVAFLDGNQTPYLDSQEMFNKDGISWKVRMDYGVAAIDYRGGYKNAGA